MSLKERYLYTVEAVSSVELRRFPRRRFEDEVARHSNLQQQLFSRLRDEMTAAQDQAVLLSRRSAEEKTGEFLPSDGTEPKLQTDFDCRPSDDAARHRRLSRHDN